MTALFDFNGDHIHDIVIGLVAHLDTSGVVLVFFWSGLRFTSEYDYQSTGLVVN